MSRHRHRQGTLAVEIQGRRRNALHKLAAGDAGAALALDPLGPALPTPGEANTFSFYDDIVINEIMYHPISYNDNDEYVELFNRGAAAVNLTDWVFTAGISYTIPAGTSLGTKTTAVSSPVLVWTRTRRRE